MHNDSLRYLYHGTSLSFLMRIAGTGAMFLALLLLARAFTTAEFGLYVYILDLIALVTPIATFGLSQMCVRVVSDSISNQQPAALRIYRRAAICFTLATALLFWAFCIVVSEYGILPEGLKGPLIPLSVALLVAITGLRLIQEMLRAARHIGLSQIVEQLIWPSLLALLAACALFGSLTMSITSLLWLQVSVMLIAWLILFITFERKITSQIASTTKRTERGQIREWLRIGLPLAMASAFSLIQYRGDVIVIGAFADQSALGPYAAAVRLAGLVIFALGAVAAAAEPLMRQNFVSGDTANLQLIVDRSACISTLLSLPAALPFIFFPSFFLSFFGPGFVSAATALSILTVGQLVNAITGPISPLIIALGLQRENLIVMTVTAVAIIIGLTSVVPVYGAVGAASTTTICAIGLNCALSRIIFLRTGIKTYFRYTALAQTLKEAIQHRNLNND